jgi:hypothetical protein
MADPVGISLAPDDYALAPTPDWERIDQDYNVTGWQIDRGRQNEMSRTDTGTARIELIDKIGDFDPTNPTGAFYGRLTGGVPMGPLVQAAICLQNPVTSNWFTLYRGFISRIGWVPYVTERFANVTLDLVDGLAVLAAMEMVPDGSFGDDFVAGNIVFNADAGLDAVQTRINNLLDQVGWDSSLRSIFTGNVALQKQPYPPRATVLSVLMDACDSEFPDIANLYIGGPRNPGKIVFHGRLARFDPTNPDYDIRTWQLGDDAANAADPVHVVRISPPLEASLDDTLLYTSALAVPQGTADGDIAGQYVTDTTGVATKGLRTWSAENLGTDGGPGGTNGLAETRLFADYIRDNFPVPRVRVGQVTVKPRRPANTSGPKTWELLCNVDISDRVHLTTTHHGGGGFDDDFYVEGIHYTAAPGSGDFPIVTLTLDVSPAGYYDANPFA